MKICRSCKTEITDSMKSKNGILCITCYRYEMNMQKKVRMSKKRDDLIQVRFTKICPECEIREIEKHCTLCSECRETNIYFTRLKAEHNYKTNNREKYLISRRKTYKKYNEKKKMELAK